MKITEQNINEALLKGSGFQNGKHRIYKFFKLNPNGDAKTFLKKEYGIGGCTGAFKSPGFTYMDHDASGLRIKTEDDKIELSWDKVARKILALIVQDKYLSLEEKKKYNIESVQLYAPLLGQVSMF